jgi:transcriptional regulator NrdR family protein
MNCVICGEATSVKDSRATKDSVKRRRVCGSCGYRFSTFEMTAASLDLLNKQVKHLATIKEILTKEAA